MESLASARLAFGAKSRTPQQHLVAPSHPVYFWGTGTEIDRRGNVGGEFTEGSKAKRGVLAGRHPGVCVESCIGVGARPSTGSTWWACEETKGNCSCDGVRDSRFRVGWVRSLHSLFFFQPFPLPSRFAFLHPPLRWRLRLNFSTYFFVGRWLLRIEGGSTYEGKKGPAAFPAIRGQGWRGARSKQKHGADRRPSFSYR